MQINLLSPIAKKLSSRWDRHLIYWVVMYVIIRSGSPCVAILIDEVSQEDERPQNGGKMGRVMPSQCKRATL